MLATGNNIAIPTEIHISDPSLSSATAHNYQLYVEIGAKAISFCAYWPTENSYCALHRVCIAENASAEVITQTISASEIYNLPFKEVVVAFETKQFTLVPKVLFNAAEVHTFGKFQFGDLGQHRAYFDSADRNDYVIVYPQLPAVRNAVTELFDNPKIVSTTSGLLNLIAQNTNDLVLAYLQSDNTLLLASYKGGNLVGANAYDVATNEDCIYFTHAFTEALGIDKSSVQLLTASNTASSLLDDVVPYFKQSAALSAATLGTYVAPIDEVKDSFNALFSLKLCV